MIDKLMKIEKLLSKANDIYEDLSDKQKSTLQEFHSEDYSLAHCLCWGLQAVQENIEGIEEDLISKPYLSIKVVKNQIYYDVMASEFVVEQYEYDGYEGGRQVPMYSVVDGFEKFMDAVKCAENPQWYVRRRMEAME